MYICKNNQCFIIITDPKNKSVIHWVSVYKYKNYFYLYDTFNRPINLSKFWKKHKKHNKC